MISPAPISRPGMMPAINRPLMEAPAATAYTTIQTLGGMMTPTVPAVATSALE